MLTVVQGPQIEPMTVTELGQHLRVDPADVMLEPYLVAVRAHVERIGGFACCTQTLEWTMDLFPYAGPENPYGAIVLPRPPLQSVVSIIYIDSSGISQTLSSSLYTVDTRSYPGRVTMVYGQSWPSTRWQPHAVVVKYLAGYAAPELVPEDVKQTLRVAAGLFYEQREAMVDGNAPAPTGLFTRLLAQHRVWTTA